MRKWIRFNTREAARTRDGLYGPLLGIPRVPRRLGELLMPLAPSAERLALEATALGLQTAFINQPVEVAGVRREFATFLGIGSRRPDLVLRIGRGPATPRSLRRPVEQVVEACS
jgi:hypothetical protein